MGSNWENFLKNQGEWRGSFTQVSPRGEILGSTPSILNLEPFENNQKMRFRIRRFGEDGETPTYDHSQEYSSLGRQILFFDTGAFSKGSLQAAPFAEFGAEFGFIDGDRRLRLVQLFDKDLKLASLTLIREFRAGSAAQENPPLTLEDLWGTWRGTAYAAYGDLREPETGSTVLTLTQGADSSLAELSLAWGGHKHQAQAEIQGNRLLFQGGERQILLLPDGASCNLPLTVPLRQPFFVEAGWLLAPNRRQRLIRFYDAGGAWVSSTLVLEEREVGG
ncbi:MAG: DUF3598 family protein [Cyanobacteria bacterium RI_101]|nr:DUF3598 family protein [Cyanobacteria bacterium RI_101]